MPTVMILAGPNGAGKTTFAGRWLRRAGEDIPFLNADEIAREIVDPKLSLAERDLRAGRLLLQRLDALVAERRDLVLETTLSGNLYARRVSAWKAAGYRVELTYLRLPAVETSLARVARRVTEGGHGVPEADIRRRFDRSLDNLERVYKPVVDTWRVWESRDGGFTLVERSAS